MAKYRIYAIATASMFLGEFEGENEEEAKAKALEENPPYASLCHQCSDEIEVGEFYKEESYLVEEVS